MFTNNRTIKTLLLSSVLLTSASAVAHTFNEADKAISYRQANFTMIAGNVGQMADMVKGKEDWNATVFTKRANELAQLSLMTLDAFAVEGSDKGKTSALPEIWKNYPDFEARMNTFQQDTANLAKVAATGDKGDIRKAFGKAVKNCKACHSDYKAR